MSNYRRDQVLKICTDVEHLQKLLKCDEGEVVGVKDGEMRHLIARIGDLAAECWGLRREIEDGAVVIQEKG